MIWVIALIVLGIVLMFIEIFLTPGFGVAGVLSLIAFVTASWYSFSFVSATAGIVTTCVSVALVVLMMVLVLRSKTWKKLELKTEVDSKVNGEADLVSPGDEGKTLTRLAPMGTAMFGSMSVEVKSWDNTMVAPGTPVRVEMIDDNKKVIVKPIND